MKYELLDYGKNPIEDLTLVMEAFPPTTYDEDWAESDLEYARRAISNYSLYEHLVTNYDECPDLYLILCGIH